MSKVTPLDDFRPVWDTSFIICWACRHRWIGVIDTRADLAHLECPECGAMEGTSVLTRAIVMSLLDES